MIDIRNCDKSDILDKTAKLNKILHDNGIKEKLRSQFVGTCLLALKSGLEFESLSTSQIIAKINDVLTSIFNDDENKENKIEILSTRIFGDTIVENLSSESFHYILSYMRDNIVPYIDDASYNGHDILSYFFTTFNKYVNRDDKNQAFTPNHIAHFMCKVARITKNSRVLDPTCGSGTFLVQALGQALSDCETDDEKISVRRNQIFGIESEDNAYGLATTNMLIHSDGNSNIVCGSCFEKDEWIRNTQADIILMNPPYNANKRQVCEDYIKEWGKSASDPSKGFYFVYKMAELLKERKGRLIALLPMQCVVGNSGIIQYYKREMLKKHTLDAVFSLPNEMFYPGANAVVCCLIFNLGIPHEVTNRDTFFGYYREDGFEKRKNIGRVDVNGTWDDVEKEWISLYENRENKIGKSLTHKVNGDDEWCPEAYMETDYSKLTQDDFDKVVRKYIAWQIQNPQYYS